MIKINLGEAIVQLGSGSVAEVVTIRDGVGAIFMRSCPPGKTKRGLTRAKKDMVQYHPELTMYFTSVEGLDHHISILTDLREQMVKCQEDKK